VVGAATPVVRVAQDGPRDAVFAVPEDTVGSIQLGMPADVRVWASGAVLPGVVREIAPSADPVTRTFTVKVVLKSKESPPLGTTVSVLPRFNASAASEGIKLPTSALYRAGERTAVWVLDGSSMTVKKTEIALGGVQGSEVLVTSGIKAGDQIVTAGVHVLTDGQKVAIYQPKTAPATTAAATTAAAK
jgi:RND family efflux transporter MFP subunit